nr:unnamed protein product [Naegleria fowleri]
MNTSTANTTITPPPPPQQQQQNPPSSSQTGTVTAQVPIRTLATALTNSSQVQTNGSSTSSSPQDLSASSSHTSASSNHHGVSSNPQKSNSESWLADQALSCFENVGPGSMSHDDHHEGLMGITALAHSSHHEQNATTTMVDHVSDSDNDDDDFISNPAANRVNDLYTLLKEEDSEGEGDHVSSLPPQQHLMKIASASPAMNKQTTSPLESELSITSESTAATNATTTTGGRRKKASSTSTPKVRGTASRGGAKTRGKGRGGAKNTVVAAASSTSSAVSTTHHEDADTMMMEDEDFADAGAIEYNDDDDYVAEHDDEDEGVTPKRKKSSRRSVGTSPMPSGDVKFVEKVEPEELSEDELMYCVVCKRSNLQVNFKKNYTINTGNYKTYCETFPQQADQIPKPKDGESLSVCSTCYNKQWRFARGQYDPYKNRAVNKREGLKNPPKLKEGAKTSPNPSSGGESSTPTLTNLSAEDQAAATALSTPSKRKVKRKVGEKQDENGAEAETKTEDDGTTPQKKKVKRATKVKKDLPPVPMPDTTGGVATQTTPSKRGRKAKATTPVSAANGGIASSSPASTMKREDATGQPTLPQPSSLFVSYYVKRAGGHEDTVYQTKFVLPKCPESVEELKSVVMERLTQKKGDIYSYDCSYCNTMDRVNNPFKVEIDDFFFNDVKLKDNDVVLVYVNEKTPSQPSETPQQPQQ